jgi:hypothetical protein
VGKKKIPINFLATAGDSKHFGFFFCKKTLKIWSDAVHLIIKNI